MFNKKTCKRRIIACESAAVADEYMNLMNLVNSFLTYEQLLSKNGDSQSIALSMNDSSYNGNNSVHNKKSHGGGAGPAFITNWVKTYVRHNGVMECMEEFFEP